MNPLKLTAKLSSGNRIAIALTMISTTVLLGLRLAGQFGDGHSKSIRQRTELCEAIAVSCSEFMSRQQEGGVETTLAGLVQRSDSVISAALRDASGTIAFAIGPHQQRWTTGEAADATCIAVPVIDGDHAEGQIEVCFRPLVARGFVGFLMIPAVRVIALATLLNGLIFSVALRRYFRVLNPQKVVPHRVRSALDTLSESIIILNNEHHIVLINSALAGVLGTDATDWQGKSLGDLPWGAAGPPQLDQATLATETPWKVLLLDTDQNARTFQMNATAILDDSGRQQGVLIGLDDVTVVESKNRILEQTLKDLRQSQAEIEEQNEKLHYLATRDPLTGCQNRRSFFEDFETAWQSSQRYDFPLSCIMIDIDHFKSINDQHGHAQGDAVLAGVAKTLRETARDTDHVCRYGGEEFCVLLPHIDSEGAFLAAERFRTAIEAIDFGHLKVTASLGLASTESEPESPDALIELGDQALYEAKRSGRNRTVRHDHLQEGKAIKTDTVANHGDAAERQEPSNDSWAQLIEAEHEEAEQLADQINSLCDTLAKLGCDPDRDSVPLNALRKLVPTGATPLSMGTNETTQTH